MAIDLIPFGSPEDQNEQGFAVFTALTAWDPKVPQPIDPGDLDAETTSLRRLYYLWSRDPLWRQLATYIGGIFAAPNAQQAQLAAARLLANAGGQTLEDLGAGVGLSRMGLGDTAYRQAIRVRGASLDSDGTIPEILSIITGLFGEAAAVGAYSPSYPAAFTLFVPSLDAAEASLLAFLLADPIPAGVGLVLVVTDATATGWSYSDPATDNTWTGPRWDYSGGSDISATGPWGFAVTVG